MYYEIIANGVVEETRELNREDDVQFWSEYVQNAVSIRKVREGKDISARVVINGKEHKVVPLPLKSRKYVFHAIIDDGRVFFDDCPTPLKELNDDGSESLPRDAVLVHRFPKMWGAKSEPMSMIVELAGQWWWRVDELPDQFWSDLVAAFKKVHSSPKTNCFNTAEPLISHLVKMTGGFQPEIVK